MNAVAVNTSLIQSWLRQQPWPLLFVTMSGAHLYGFASPDSDYDLRGAHVTPLRKLVSLSPPADTHEVMDKSGPVEMDIVTHDVTKFIRLLLKNNGYVLEQLCSPIVLHATPEFEELRGLAPRCVTRHHKHHFLSFSHNQWELVVKRGKPTVKGLLYTYRVLLAGIPLMRTGIVESNILALNQDVGLPFIDELVAMKIAGPEKAELRGHSLEQHEREFSRLCLVLDEVRAASALPDEPSCRDELNELLVRIRMKHP